MPIINITETEEQRLAQFDASENSVLIPVVINSEAAESLSLEPIKFRSASEFKQFYTDNLKGKDEDEDHATEASCMMAYELLLQGMPVVIQLVSVEDDNIGSAIESAINEFDSKNGDVYNIKFITTGALSNIKVSTVQSGEGTSITTDASLFEKILTVAEHRKDCIALAEFNSDIKEDELLSVNMSESDYAAAFYPQCEFNCSLDSAVHTLPACFAYLMAYAHSVKSNANWFAAAGALRGYIPKLVAPTKRVSESLMHSLQGDSNSGSTFINPIYDTGAYGIRVWGNRTLKNINIAAKDKFTNFLNIRVLLCDLKKQIYHGAMRATFEPNDDILWFNFKALVNPLLERMKSGRGLKSYRWVRQTPDERARISCALEITPIEAVESFEVEIRLTDEEVTVNEA